MEDDVGSERIDGGPDRGAVGHVQGVDVGREDLEGAGVDRLEDPRGPACDGATVRQPSGQNVTEVPAQLPVPAGDQHPQRAVHEPDEGPAGGSADQDPSTTGARSRSGSHQLRLAAYQATVSARPCSKGTVGSQPSSRRIFDESSR